MRHATAAAALALAALAAAPASAAAWFFDDHVRGDGKKSTVVRELPPFEAIRLEGSLDVNVKVGPAQSVQSTIDQNLQPELELRVDGRTLVIGTRKSVHYDGAGRIEVTVPALTGFRLEGSGDARIEDGAGPLAVALRGSGDVVCAGAFTALTVKIDGSGDVRLSGRADQLTVAVNGSGDVDAEQLSARDATVAVHGSGDVSVRLDGGALQAAIEGSGDVLWTGDARVADAAVRGSGTVRKH